MGRGLNLIKDYLVVALGNITAVYIGISLHLVPIRAGFDVVGLIDAPLVVAEEEVVPDIKEGVCVCHKRVVW